MNLWLRYQAWRYGVCYKHKRERETVSYDFGAITWCNSCTHEKLEKKQSNTQQETERRNRIICKLKKNSWKG